MKNLGKWIATGLILAAFLIVATQALTPGASQLGTQQVLRYEQTGATTQTLYLYWPAVYGVAQIPLLTTSLAKQSERLQPEVNTIQQIASFEKK